MVYETVRVNIFQTTAELCLDPFRFQETKPMYAAMVPGSASYYAFTEELENLPRELAYVTGHNKKVVPGNLPKGEYFKEIKFGDSDQAVSVRHDPLTPSQLETFISAAIWQISFARELQKSEDAAKKIIEDKLSSGKVKPKTRGK